MFFLVNNNFFLCWFSFCKNLCFICLAPSDGHVHIHNMDWNIGSFVFNYILFIYNFHPFVFEHVHQIEDILSLCAQLLHRYDKVTYWVKLLWCCVWTAITKSSFFFLQHVSMLWLILWQFVHYILDLSISV